MRDKIRKDYPFAPFFIILDFSLEHWKQLNNISNGDAVIGIAADWLYEELGIARYITRQCESHNWSGNNSWINGILL